MEIDLDKIRNFFSADRFAMAAGIGIDSVREDQVECSMEITGAHRNAGGAVQGGAIFTLADLAFAVHSTWISSAATARASPSANPAAFLS